jgi:hypothetical protein
LWGVSNFTAGAGDFLSGGLSSYARKGVSKFFGMGYGENVNYGSRAYVGGEVTGATVAVAGSALVAARLFAGVETKVAIHGAHHAFEFIGRVPHLQVMWWIAGGSLTQLFSRGELIMGSPIRIPLTPWWP